jgi:hypothetical protein
MNKIFACFFIVVVLVSCVKKNEEELLSDFKYCKDDSISFSQNILPIIHKDCGTCHNPNTQSGGVTLHNYSDISFYANNGILLGVIKHESGFSPMPKNAPKLIECKISTIEKWIQEGTQNN